MIGRQLQHSYRPSWLHMKIPPYNWLVFFVHSAKRICEDVFVCLSTGSAVVEGAFLDHGICPTVSSMDT